MTARKSQTGGKDDLLTALEALRKVRNLGTETQAKLKDEQAQFDVQHTDLIQDIKAFKSAIDDLDRQVRSLAESLYAADPSTKQIAPGVSIRETVEVEITHPDQALAWCIARDLLLQVDDKAYKSFAKIEFEAGRKLLPGVRIAKGQQATIARDLPTQNLPAPVVLACNECNGCHYKADDDDGSPWWVWESLPKESKVAVELGLVQRIPCPSCNTDGALEYEPVEQEIAGFA